jgi:hypothetical protein
MPFEVRIRGQTTHVCESQQEAAEHARHAVKADPDGHAEILDSTTGRSAAPAASQHSREDLAKKVGY